MCREQYRTYTGMQVDVRMFRVNGFDRSNNFNNSIFNHVWSFLKQCEWPNRNEAAKWKRRRGQRVITCNLH